MDVLSLALFLLFTLVLVKVLPLILGMHKKGKNLPPGPKPLPVIGNLLVMRNKPHKSLAELAKIYGPIMSLKLGQITTIVISSPAVAKEVHQKQDLAFCNRWLPDTSYIHDRRHHTMVDLPVGERWRSLRKILTSNISGSKLNYHKDLRRHKVEELISFVGSHSAEGAVVVLQRAAFATSMNILSNIIFSVDMTDLTQESPGEDLIRKSVLELGKPNFSDFFPFLAVLDAQGIRKRITLYVSKLLDIVVEMIDQRSDLRESSPETDLMDVLLTAKEKGELDKKQIQHFCMGAFCQQFQLCIIYSALYYVGDLSACLDKDSSFVWQYKTTYKYAPIFSFEGLSLTITLDINLRDT